MNQKTANRTTVKLGLLQVMILALSLLAVTFNLPEAHAATTNNGITISSSISPLNGSHLQPGGELVYQLTLTNNSTSSVTISQQLSLKA